MSASEFERLQYELQELKTKVAEEARVREALHRAIAQGDPASVIAAVAAAKGSLGKAEMAWADQGLRQAQRSLEHERVVQQALQLCNEDPKAAASKCKAFLGQSYSSPDGLIPRGDLNRVLVFYCASDHLQEKHLDVLMDQFCLHQGIEEKDAMICYKSFVDFLFPSQNVADQQMFLDANKLHTWHDNYDMEEVVSEGLKNEEKTNGVDIHLEGNSLESKYNVDQEEATDSKRIPKEVSERRRQFAKRLSVEFKEDEAKDIQRSEEEASDGSVQKVSKSGRKSFLKRCQSMNTKEYSYDLLIVGGGPAGLKAAVECANRGFRVGVVDGKEVLTGAPTGSHSKCLREAALEGAKTWAEASHVFEIANQRSAEATSTLIKMFHIEHLHGRASFPTPDTLLFQPVQGEPRSLKADCFVIATGSIARRAPEIPFHLPGVFDTDTISSISYIPRCLVVQGAGIAALEYANIFALLGSRVILVHAHDRIMKTLDKELLQAVLGTMEENKVEFRLNTPINSVESVPPVAGSVTHSLVVDTGDDRIECDCLLIAAGRTGSSLGMGLENLGVKLCQSKYIVIDKSCHTGVGNIFAIGDVTGGTGATQGKAQAIQVVNANFHQNEDHSEHLKEYVDFVAAEQQKACMVWTIPEIAWAGMTEEMAIEKGFDADTARADYRCTIRGVVTGDNGFLKIVFDRTDGKVLGFHICGEHAGDLIVYGTEIIREGDSVFNIVHIIFPAVTYHELYQIAAHRAQMILSNEDLRINTDGRCDDAVSSFHAATIWNRVKMAFTQGGFTIEDLEIAFSEMDTDSSGSLGWSELGQALRMVGFDIPDEVAKMMIYQADTSNDDGEIQFPELKKAIVA